MNKKTILFWIIAHKNNENNHFWIKDAESGENIFCFAPLQTCKSLL
jgi:hypothetical protein